MRCGSTSLKLAVTPSYEFLRFAPILCPSVRLIPDWEGHQGPSLLPRLVGRAATGASHATGADAPAPPPLREGAGAKSRKQRGRATAKPRWELPMGHAPTSAKGAARGTDARGGRANGRMSCTVGTVGSRAQKSARANPLRAAVAEPEAPPG